MDKKYIVLDHKKYSGLTVGDYSRKPGFIFIQKNFRGSDEDFQHALKEKRCKLVDEKPEKKESKKRKKDDSQ